MCQTCARIFLAREPFLIHAALDQAARNRVVTHPSLSAIVFEARLVIVFHEGSESDKNALPFTLSDAFTGGFVIGRVILGAPFSRF